MAKRKSSGKKRRSSKGRRRSSRRRRMSAIERLYGRTARARSRSRGHANWKQSSSDCDIRPGRFPCKTTYMYGKTGKKVVVRATRSAQFAMPQRLRSLADLRGTPGVIVPKIRRLSRGGRRR